MSEHKEAARYFATMKRAERERLERMADVEFKKVWMLKCATGGAMRGNLPRPPVTLPKLKFMEKK